MVNQSRREMIVSRLREMRAAFTDIDASAVVSVDGLIFLEMRRAAEDLLKLVG